jgi:hypothetical protein
MVPLSVRKRAKLPVSTALVFTVRVALLSSVCGLGFWAVAEKDRDNVDSRTNTIAAIPGLLRRDSKFIGSMRRIPKL